MKRIALLSALSVSTAAAALLAQQPSIDGPYKVLKTARVVRPWDAAHFTNLTLSLRPWFDMRHITGPFIFQLRQGIDWSLLRSGRVWMNCFRTCSLSGRNCGRSR